MHNNQKIVLCGILMGLTVLLSQPLYSQSTHLDSLEVSELEKDIRVENPFIGLFHPFDFSQTSFRFQRQNQKFKRVQSPASTSDFTFQSQGAFQLNDKVVVSGNLKAARIVEKEVPYTLSDERTTEKTFPSNPSYFWAPRSAQWLKQHYFVDGKIGYRPIKPVILQLGAKGVFEKSYRQNADPRPEIDNYEYNIDGKLGLSLGKNTFFGKMRYVNTYKTSNIMFVSDNGNVPANDSIYIRYNEGYGNQYQDSEYSNSEYQKDGIIYGASYSYNNAAIHFSVDYDYQNTIERFFKVYQYQDAEYIWHRDYTKYSALKSDIHSVNINFLGNISSKRIAAKLRYIDQLDLNYNYALNYNSYKLALQEFLLSARLSSYNAKNENRALLLDINSGSNKVHDASVVLDREISYVSYLIGYEKEFNTGDNQKLAISLQQSFYKPFSNSFLYTPYQSNKVNTFVEKIAKPDYAYDSTPKLGLNIGAKYKFDHGKIRYEFFASFAQKWLAGKEYQQMVTDYQRNRNTQGSVGIKVYY